VPTFSMTKARQPTTVRTALQATDGGQRQQHSRENASTIRNL